MCPLMSECLCVCMHMFTSGWVSEVKYGQVNGKVWTGEW